MLLKIDKYITNLSPDIEPYFGDNLYIFHFIGYSLFIFKLPPYTLAGFDLTTSLLGGRQAPPGL
jgi:hypothetical protein